MQAREDIDLQLRLREDRLVFFLHLLGCDSNGHANNPGSKEYEDNVRVVDKGVKKARILSYS